jgi:hypothetical protein
MAGRRAATRLRPSRGEAASAASTSARRLSVRSLNEPTVEWQAGNVVWFDRLANKHMTPTQATLKCNKKSGE